MDQRHYYVIHGKKDGIRLDSRVVEEQIQSAVDRGYRDIKVVAFGQHGIGGRLWKAGDDPVCIRIEGHPGQRVGSMGFANTRIEIAGPASDDVGWLNAGAEIVVHGHAGNGVANAMAQGKVFVAGNIGARGMTMTKQNPRFDPPQLWVLGSVGDYFGEFMAGGIAVVCGHDPQNKNNVLGYRPFVGTVGGRTYFRGAHAGYSETDVRQIPIDDQDWIWLEKNLKAFLDRIERADLHDELAVREQWQVLVARTPAERIAGQKRSMSSFRRGVWDAELGKNGLVGDLSDIDKSPIPLIVTDKWRRFVPAWENRKYASPCEAACPTGIPVHERWRLVREGRVDEAVDLAMAYTPFPATICGYLCPNLCMQACNRESALMAPVDVTGLGKASLQVKLPVLPPLSGRRIAVIGGGPAGISAAWQLRRQGHEAVVYDLGETLGGKIAAAIPESRLPREVFSKEIERMRSVIALVHLKQKIQESEFERMREDFDFIVIAVGAQKPRHLPISGIEHAESALEFLAKAKAGGAKTGKRVVIIGAGNVGCDAAAEANRFGAEKITLIDIQAPASFGKERKSAEAAGAHFRWPVKTEKITPEGVVLDTGELLEADTVIVSIGDVPDLSFLPDDIAVSNGFVTVDAVFQSSDPKVFAIGDAVRPGLLTDAVGAGRIAASAIGRIIENKKPQSVSKSVIERERVKLAYYDPRIVEFKDNKECGDQCASCGSCRDCGICEAICPQNAIRRIEKENDGYAYEVDEFRCIGCGFCAGACPCGIWSLVENTPLV